MDEGAHADKATTVNVEDQLFRDIFGFGGDDIDGIFYQILYFVCEEPVSLRLALHLLVDDLVPRGELEFGVYSDADGVLVALLHKQFISVLVQKLNVHVWKGLLSVVIEIRLQNSRNKQTF